MPKGQIFDASFMNLIRHSSKIYLLLFGLVLLLLAMNLGHAWAAAQPSGVQAGHGGTAGNGASGSGKAEGILIAEILLLLVVGRLVSVSPP
jgi:hypothetical protein